MSRRNRRNVQSDRDLSPDAEKNSSVSLDRASSQVRDDSCVQPIVLGGRRVLPMSFTSDDCRSPLVPVDVIENLDELLRTGGFSDDEIRYLIASHIDRVPRCEMHHHLDNWTTAKTEWVRKSIAAKIANHPKLVTNVIQESGGNSIFLSYERELWPGHRVWTLSDVSLTGAFSEEIGRAREKSMRVIEIPKIKNLTLPIRRRVRIMSFRATELKQNLTAERTKFDRLVTQNQSIDTEIRKLEGEIHKLKNSDDAVLLADDYPRKLTSLENALTDAERRREGCKKVLERQRAAVIAIEDEIAANAFAAFTEDLAPHKKALHKALEHFVEEAAKAALVAERHSAVGRLFDVGVVFDPLDPKDHLAGSTERMHKAQLFQTALQLYAYRRLVTTNAKEVAV